MKPFDALEKECANDKDLFVIFSKQLNRHQEFEMPAI